MKHKRLFLIMISMLLFVLAGCAEDQTRYSGTLITGGEHHLGEGDPLNGELLITGGTVSLDSGGQLNGSVYIIGGVVALDGTVRGDVYLMAGELALGAQAVIVGDLHYGGGELAQDPEATIQGTFNTGAGVRLPGLPEPTEPTFAEEMLRLVVQTLLMAGLAALAARFAPGSVQNMAYATADHPVVCGAMGLLIIIVVPALLLAMAFTILLIPLTLLGIVFMAVTIVYGWSGLWLAIGRRLSRLLKREWSPVRGAFWGAVGFGVFAGVLNFIIPSLGGLLLFVAGVLGLGAVTLTRFGVQRYVPAAAEPIFETSGPADEALR